MTKYKPIRALKVPSSIDKLSLWIMIVIFQFLYAISGLIIGGYIVLLGIDLLVIGLGGSIDWRIHIIHFESEITNASSGVIIAIIGLITIFLSNYDIKSNPEYNKNQNS